MASSSVAYVLLRALSYDGIRGDIRSQVAATIGAASTSGPLQPISWNDLMSIGASEAGLRTEGYARAVLVPMRWRTRAFSLRMGAMSVALPVKFALPLVSGHTPNLLVSNSNDFAIFQLTFYTGAPPNNYGGGTTVGPTVGVDIGTPSGPGPTTVPLPQGVWTFVSVSAVASNVGLNHVNSMGAYLLDINADANADFYFDDMSLTMSVPEPSTMVLVLTGLAGGIHFFRKRRS